MEMRAQAAGGIHHNGVRPAGVKGRPSGLETGWSPTRIKAIHGQMEMVTDGARGGGELRKRLSSSQGFLVLSQCFILIQKLGDS